MTNFEEVTDNILLRIPSYRANNPTKDFLLKYCPLLAKKPSGSWTSIPPSFDSTQEILTRHSLIFKKHPFLDINMKEGRLDLLTKEKNNNNSGYLTYFITLVFVTKETALNFFEHLCSTYEPLSFSKTKISLPDRQVAIYKEDNKTVSVNQIQLLMTKDDFFDNRYKIVIGTILDPDFDEYYGSQHAVCC